MILLVSGNLKLRTLSDSKTTPEQKFIDEQTPTSHPSLVDRWSLHRLLSQGNRGILKIPWWKVRTG